jgi:hypothetical protein
VRRLRRGGPPAITCRRFLIVQIDGLSRGVLDQGLASGHLTFVTPLLRRFGALLVGFYRRRKLVYAGKVGTGFDSNMLRHLGRKLARLETSTCPFTADGLARRGAHWVKPKLVAQIGFTQCTADDKLRHPRFLGLREDKKPEEVVRED